MLRVRPNIIDKVRKRDVEIERRLKEIDNYLNGNYYRGRMNKLLYGSYKRNWYKRQREWEKSILKNKSLPRILNECEQGLV